MPTDEAITPEGVESRFAERGFVTTGEVAMAGAMRRLEGQTDEFFSRRFLLPRPLLQAITSEAPVRELVRRV